MFAINGRNYIYNYFYDRQISMTDSQEIIPYERATIFVNNLPADALAFEYL